jgi:hypothetical protein
MQLLAKSGDDLLRLALARIYKGMSTINLGINPLRSVAFGTNTPPGGVLRPVSLIDVCINQGHSLWSLLANNRGKDDSYL